MKGKKLKSFIITSIILTLIAVALIYLISLRIGNMKMWKFILFEAIVVGTWLVISSLNIVFHIKKRKIETLD